ncbi:MAG: hypothetical protein L0229_10915 [Blastocatellia bacterium]|nr:hypothetical protein [Blastocatellia bacterium]
MAKSHDFEFAITPDQCVAALPEIAFDPGDEESDDGLRRAELQQSQLAIAELNHVSETALVQSVVKHALGKLPEFEE